jgi:hypothetical protein
MRFGQGITNELDVALAERCLVTLQAGTAPMEAQIAASKHVVAVLIGQFAEDLASGTHKAWKAASPGNENPSRAAC